MKAARKERAIKPQPIQPTSFRIPCELLREAKHYAIDHGVTLQDLVIDGLRLRLKGRKRR
jgi:hypothetical protein